MAKIVASDLMLLNRDNNDGSRSVYSYTGLDFNNSVQQVIDDNKLYDLYVNMAGDDMSGLLTIDVNRDLINPENLLCLDVEGRINTKQIYFDPTNDDAAHISMYFQGNREHLVYYENHINIVDRQLVAGEVDDKIMFQMERENIHIHSTFSIGTSAVIPTITLRNDGSASFDGKVLLADITDLDYNHATHRGYVDELVDDVRQEVLDLVQVDVTQDNYFENVNFESTIEYGLDRFTYDLTLSTAGLYTITFAEPPAFGDQQTNWASVVGVTINKTKNTGDIVDENIYIVGNTLNINNATGPAEDHYNCASYDITGVVDNGSTINLTLEHDFTSEGDPPNPIDGDVYVFSVTNTISISELRPGTFYWVTVPNSIDTQGNPVEDWRSVNQLFISLTDHQGNSVNLTNFKVNSDIETSIIDTDGVEVVAANYTIKESERTTITQIDPASFLEINIECIKLTLEFKQSGEDINFSPGVLHNLRVESVETIESFFKKSDEILGGNIENNTNKIASLEDDIRRIENAFSSGRLGYLSASGTTQTGRFSLNDISGSPINTLSNNNIAKIYLSKYDIDGGYREWIPEGIDDISKTILFTEVNESTITEGHGEFLLDDFTDHGSYVEFDVTFSSGSSNANNNDSEYSIKIVSANEGISAIEAYNTFVSKSGDSAMSGTFSISDVDENITIKLEDTGIFTLGNVANDISPTISLRGDLAFVKFNLNTVMTLSTDDILIDTAVDMNGNIIRGLPTPNGSQDTHAANVSYVKQYVEEKTATETETGGIKVKHPFSMDGDFLTIGESNVVNTDNVQPSDMGVCAFNSLTFEQSTVSGTNFISARVDATYNDYGMVKITTPMKLDSDGRLTVNTTSLLYHNNSQLTVRSGTTSQTGVVQLHDSVESESTSRAATANAVKTAYDQAVRATNGNFKAGQAVVNPNSSGASHGGFYQDNGNLYWKN